MNRTSNSICDLCGSSFYRRPSAISKYSSCACSIECRTELQKRYLECPNCKTKFQGSRDRKYCCRSCANSSRKGITYTGLNTNNKHAKTKRQKEALIELRGESCERCGYNVNTNILVIHHIVYRSNGGSDDLDNLQLICPNCHAIEHYVS